MTDGVADGICRSAAAMTRVAAVGLLALSVSGCGGIGGVYLIGEVIHWTKPGFEQHQLDVDWYQCRRENTQDGTIQPQNTKACMAARGYSYTETGI